MLNQWQWSITRPVYNTGSSLGPPISLIMDLQCTCLSLVPHVFYRTGQCGIIMHDLPGSGVVGGLYWYPRAACITYQVLVQWGVILVPQGGLHQRGDGLGSPVPQAVMWVLAHLQHMKQCVHIHYNTQGLLHQGMDRSANVNHGHL